MKNQINSDVVAEPTEVVENPLETSVTEVVSENEPSEDGEEKKVKTYSQEEMDAKLSKQHNRAQRKFDRQMSELKSQVEELRKAQKSAGESTSEVAKPPKRDDFDSYEDYIGAKARFDASEEIRKEITALKQERAKEVSSDNEAKLAAELDKAAAKRVADGRKEFPDFDATIQDAFDEGIIEPGTELYLGIIESTVGHRIAMHLAKNPDLAEKINNLSPRGVQREIGKLEDKFSKPTSPKEKSPTIDEVSGKRNIKLNDPMREDIPMDEYVKLRNAEEMKRRKGL